MLDLVVLALVAIVSLGLGLTLLAVLLTGFADDAGDQGGVWIGMSFDDAIRDHLELKRRHALSEEADKSGLPGRASSRRGPPDHAAAEAFSAGRGARAPSRAAATA